MDKNKRPFRYQWSAAVRESTMDYPNMRVNGKRVKPDKITTVAFALAEHMDPDGSNCYPGMRLLAAETKLGESTVRRAVQVMERTGWHTIIPKGSPKGDTDLYVPSIPRTRERVPRGRKPASSKGRKGASSGGREPIQDQPLTNHDQPAENASESSVAGAPVGADSLPVVKEPDYSAFWKHVATAHDGIDRFDWWECLRDGDVMCNECWTLRADANMTRAVEA